MRLLQRFSRGEFTLDHTEAFRDGVLAIIVTLLVLELKATLAWMSINAAFAVYALTPLFTVTPCNERAAAAGATHTKAKPRL